MLRDNMTPAQISDVEWAARKKLELLVESISKLDIRNLEPGSEAELAQNNAKILELSREKATIKARRALFRANQLQIDPPSTELLDSLEMLIAKVEQLVIDDQIMSNVVDLVSAAATVVPELEQKS